MANLLISAAGAAIGFAIGGPAGAQIGWAVGGVAAGVLNPQKSEGPRLEDLRVNGTAYGATIPWMAGSPRISGQIVWASNKRETANTESAKGGPEATTYTYDCDLLILLTENEIAGVSRVWVNSELVYGAGTTKSGVWGSLTVYTGTDDQMPDPTYEAAVGAGNAPAYRGRGYVVIQGLQLGAGGSIPNLTFEVGTAFERDYSVVKYLFTPTGSGTETLQDQSIYAWEHPQVAAGGLVTGDNEFRLGVSPGGYIELQDDGAVSGTGLVDYAGDFTFEMDAYFEHGGGVTHHFFGAFFGSSLGLRSFVLDLNSVGSYGQYIVHFPIGQNTFTDFPSWINFTVDKPKSHFVNQWMTVVFRKAGDKAQCFIKDTLFIDRTLTAGEQALLLDISRVPTHLGSENSDISPGVTRMKNIRFATRDMYPEGLSDGFTRMTPPTNYYESVVFGSKTPETLPVTLNGLLLRSAYSEDDFDVNEIDGVENLVRGLAVGQTGATRATLDLLKSAYFFEASKSDKIYIRPRAVDPVATIYYADMGAADDPSADAAVFELTKSNDIEIPAQVALSYNNMDGDYNVATEYSDRVLSEQESTQAVQMALGFLPAEAKAIADAMIIDAATSVMRATIKVPLRYAYIEPGDVIEAVNEDGRTYRLRVQTKRDTLTIIELECVLDDVGALDSAALTDTGYTEAGVIQVSETEFEALDIPILRDADNLPGYYIAAAPTNVGDDYEWKGALVARSWDDVSYSELFKTTTASVMGSCSTTLGNFTGGNVIDETNTLTVVTTGGELSSSTRAAMQLDATINVAAIGSAANGWEIVRFTTATLTDTNTYRLSGFHRGFRGTEWAMAGHGSGEQFVLLNAGVGHVQAQTSQIGLVRYIKAATFGLFLSTVDSEAFTDTGVALKPFSPVNANAIADGSDLVVTWQRRTRVSYVYGGATPTVPLGEATEQYRVRIFDGSTLVRTETVTTPTYTYTAANLSADGFASTDAVTFEICQLSEILGAGYPAECEGTAP